jgi:hypothetical protein
VYRLIHISVAAEEWFHVNAGALAPRRMPYTINRVVPLVAVYRRSQLAGVVTAVEDSMYRAAMKMSPDAALVGSVTVELV